MLKVDVRIQSVEDAIKGVPAIEGVAPTELVQAQLDSVAILEAGMKSGEASVMFHFILPGPMHVYAETSANLFHAMDKALQGAEERFAEQTYRLILNARGPGSHAIHCKRCGLTSYNRNDVREKFCSKCGFH